MFTNLLSAPTRIARDHLVDRLNKLPTESKCAILPENPALVDMLFGAVRGQLEQIVTPTLALELNVSRLRGELVGSSAAVRYAHFVDRLSQPDYVAGIAQEYPELFRLADERLAMWIETSVELVERLSIDWPAIQRTFFGETSPGPLTDLRFVQRSTKRGGRAVVVLAFASGDQLVYKPRSLAAEQAFQELLGWLNATGFDPGFRLLRVLERQTHGWMEWIVPASCKTEEEVERFYRRQGAYLALFYILEATDLHMSNVIAAGEHPMIIDLEALFHPRDAAADWPALDLLLDDTIYYSVLRPGILPEPETASDGCQERFDLSGLTGRGGQHTPYMVPTWVAHGTDVMRLDMQQRTTRGGKNRPTLRGQLVEPSAYIGQLDEGFTQAYRLLLAQRDELLAPGGHMERFAGIELRVMRRSGFQYETIRERSYHPDLLRNDVARSHFIRQELTLDADGSPDLLALLPAELRDLETGDVPVFATRNGSRDVVDSRARVIPGLLQTSGWQMAVQRIAALDEADLARQRWFIRASFATLSETTLPTERDRRPSPDVYPGEVASQALRAAHAVGRLLQQSAIGAGDEVSWIGLEPDEEGHWAIEYLSAGLAHGLSGVVHFLTRLAALTRDPAWESLGRRASNAMLRYMLEDAAEIADPAEPIGLFEGIGGQLYGLSHATADCTHPHRKRVLGQLIQQSEFILSEASDEESPGLAHGIAGLLTGLLAAHHLEPSMGALTVARLAGDALLSRLTAISEDIPNEPFGIFWHGVAGAAGPLLSLAGLSGETRFRAMAESLLEHSLSPESPDLGQWRAYLFARPWLQNTALRGQLDAALADVLPNLPIYLPVRDHSIGSGALGVVDLLLEAGSVLEDVRVQHRAFGVAAAVLADMATVGPQSAVPMSVETPGFMTGLAGIGYGLLRAAEPTRNPAFPTLLAPRGRTVS